MMLVGTSRERFVLGEVVRLDKVDHFNTFLTKSKNVGIRHLYKDNHTHTRPPHTHTNTHIFRSQLKLYLQCLHFKSAERSYLHVEK